MAKKFRDTYANVSGATQIVPFQSIADIKIGDTKVSDLLENMKTTFDHMFTGFRKATSYEKLQCVDSLRKQALASVDPIVKAVNKSNKMRCADCKCQIRRSSGQVPASGEFEEVIEEVEIRRRIFRKGSLAQMRTSQSSFVQPNALRSLLELQGNICLQWENYAAALETRFNLYVEKHAEQAMIRLQEYAEGVDKEFQAKFWMGTCELCPQHPGASARIVQDVVNEKFPQRYPMFS